MKHIAKVVVAACVTLLVSSLCFAQAQPAPAQAPAPAPATVVVTSATIDFGMVMTKSKDGAAIAKKMADTFDARQKKLNDEGAALNKLAQELNPNVKGPKYTEFQTRRAKLLRENDQFNQEVQQAEASLSAPLREKALATITAFCKERGILTVQDRRGLIYADPQLDITTEIIKRLDGVQ